MIKLAISGVAGRMGRLIAKHALESEKFLITGGIEHLDSDHLGDDIGELIYAKKLGVWIQSSLLNIEYDVLVDFSRPVVSVKHVQHCAQIGRAVVVGTTGLDEKQIDEIRQASEQIPVLLAANTSLGVSCCVALVEQAAKVLGNVTDVEIIESHHKHKVDAPSGTALLLGRAIAGVLGKQLPEDGVFTRYGHTGARQQGSIGFSTIRGGDIVGEHTVMFIAEGERLEITHRATDRSIFARGAVTAAHWIADQKPGLYSMRDVLSLDS